MRTALWVSASFNLGAAFFFAFPSSWPGQLVGLPAIAPPVYRGVLAVFEALFGGAYVWLARRPVIDRPLVALGAMAKASAVTLIFILGAVGEVSGRFVLASSGDLVLAGIFAWWLLGAQQALPADVAASRPRG
jgi:hypothetical protein